jgi:penicillin-binding protein 2
MPRLGNSGPRDTTSSTSLAARQQQLARFDNRIQGAALILFALALVLMGRLLFLQVGQFLHFRTLSNDNRIAVRPILPPRGLVYDRHNRLLAQNEPSFTLRLYPEKVDNLEAMLDRLARELPLTTEQRSAIERRLAEREPYQPITLARGLDDASMARFAVRQHEYPSIRIRARSRRRYLEDELTAHVLGYVGQPDKQDYTRFDAGHYPPGSRLGKMGVERSYEETLHGSPGQREVETDAFGRVVRELSTTPPEPGHNLVLTLDRDLQAVTHRALANTKEAAAVALDPGTGGILAMTSRPTFDPNQFIGQLTSRGWNELRNNPLEPLLNRVTQGLYPPASTIKPAIAVGALKRGIVEPDTRFTCRGSFRIPKDDHTFHCWRRSGHGPLNLKQALAQSCDVFFYKVARRLKIGPLHKTLAQFGLGERTGVDLPSEGKGINPSRKWKRKNRHEVWFPGETINTGIGQGYLEATPLQLARMTAALANGGHLVQPHVVRGIEDPVSHRLRYRRVVREPVNPATEENMALVRSAMRNVVASVNGTAHTIAGGPVPIAGKTGTAQVVGLDQERRDLDPEEVERSRRDHGLFVAFAPARSPEIAVAVVVEHGVSGGGKAARIARRMIESYLEE